MFYLYLSNDEVIDFKKTKMKNDVNLIFYSDNDANSH